MNQLTKISARPKRQSIIWKFIP